ncbi:MAG: hypothetical protein JRG81_12095 [Deltaproteobacteria bacterium]|nr:hypothetical protein [Deltaproteobacteria bacterium]
MIPFADSKYLRSSDYDIKVPFRSILESGAESVELVCTHIARILPGKRLVCFGDLDGQQVVAKFFLDSGGAKRHSARELRGVKAFKTAKIKTPELLFKGRQGPENLPVLCFRRIVPSEDLFEAWERQTEDEQRIRLLSRAVAVVADQHKAGLKQNDLHRENFLLSGEDIYSIDGDAVDVRKMGKPLLKKGSLKNLALFFTHLYPHREQLIKDIFKVYAEKRGWELTDRLYNQLIEEIRRKKNQRKNEYLKKTYRECTEFVCHKKWSRFMVCSRDNYSQNMSKLLNDPDPYMGSGELLKAGNTATLALVTVDGRDVVIKRYNIKNFLHGFRRFFRPSRAWVSWRNAHLLTYMNIPTPKPIAFMERRWGPFRKSAYFITEYAQGLPLNHVFGRQSTHTLDIDAIVEKVGVIIQSLVDQMIGHGDTKASNFIVSEDDIKIVDLDVMKEYTCKWKFRRSFKRDSERFLKNWAGVSEIEQKFRQLLLRINR